MKIIKLKGNPNIRDIGGVYKNVTIKEGKLIRGRTLRCLSDYQREYLVTNKMSKKKAFKYYMTIKYGRFDALFALKVGRTFLAKR